MTRKSVRTERANTDRDRVPENDAVGSRREFLELAAKVGAGTLGLGGLLALSQHPVLTQAATPQIPAVPGVPVLPGGSALHDRRLDRETIMGLQQMGIDLIAYAYGIEARGANAKNFLSIDCPAEASKTKNGTTCTTCCHPDKRWS